MTNSTKSTPDFYSLLQALPRAHRPPIQQAVFRGSPDDFQVSEQLGFEGSGDGDHLLLQIQKRGLNTQDVLDLLTKRFAVKPVDIGYCGLKDKHAVTEQWMSVHLPGKTVQALQDLGIRDVGMNTRPDQDLEIGQGARVLQASRHHRKLRIGSHRANRFLIVLKDLHGNSEQLERSFMALEHSGFPNYFGEQRFGHQARNLYLAHSLFTESRNGESAASDSKSGHRNSQRTGSRKVSRKQRSLYLSAARSFLFNVLLAARIDTDSWVAPLPGEPLMLEGSKSIFTPDTDAVTQLNLSPRLQSLDIHTTGALWGRSKADSTHEMYEAGVLSAYSDMLQGLDRAGLDQARRALRVVPRRLTFERRSASSVHLGFELPTGAYATSLLRELVLVLKNASLEI